MDRWRRDSEIDQVISAVVAGLPKAVELIGGVPAEGRPRALAAAEKSYVQTALELGYHGAAARQWAVTIMPRLQAELPQQSEDDENEDEMAAA